MLIAVIISTFISLFAILSYLSDFFLGSINFTALTCITSAAIIYLLSRVNELKPEASRQSVISYSVFSVVFIYMLFLSFPSFYPLRLSWDGANHLAIMTYLEQHLNHGRMAANQFSLSWGGNLFTYPWGMHAAFVGFSRLFNVKVFLVINSLVSLMVAAMVASLISYLIKLKISYYSAFLSFLFMISFWGGIYYMVYYGYWSQIAAILIFLSIIYLLEMEYKGWVLFVFMLAGIALIYPLYALSAYSAFLAYIFFKKPRDYLKAIFVALISFLLSLCYIWPSFSDNIVRRVIMNGSGLWFGLKDINSIIVIFIFAVSSISSAYFLIRKKVYYCIFPLVALFFTLIAFIFLKTGGISRYYFFKTVYLNLVLFIPVFCMVMDKTVFGSKRTKRGRSLVPLIFFLFLLFSFVFFFPKYYLNRVKPALTEDEYRMREWTKENIKEETVFYIAHGYKIYWYEALSEKPSMKVAPNFRMLLIRRKGTYSPEALLNKFVKEASIGDFIIADKRDIILPEENFKVVHIEGDMVLYRFLGKTKKNVK